MVRYGGREKGTPVTSTETEGINQGKIGQLIEMAYKGEGSAFRECQRDTPRSLSAVQTFRHA